MATSSSQSGNWLDFPPPPTTNPPATNMNPRSMPDWLYTQAPDNYTYYDNLFKGVLDESLQLQNQAMQAFNQRQREMSLLLNREAANLGRIVEDRTAQYDSALGRTEAGQQAGILAMGEGANAYQQYLNSALGMQGQNLAHVLGEQQRAIKASGDAASTNQQYLGQAMRLQDEALSANPLKYQHYIDTGTLPEGVDAALRAQRDQTIASARTELDRQMAQANSALKQQMSAMGMQDSEYAAIQNARLAGEAGRAMTDVIEKQNSSYLQSRLEQPYKMQAAATGTMQSYNPFIGNVLAGGAQQASKFQALGDTIANAANTYGSLGNQAVGQTLTGGAQQASNLQNIGKSQMDAATTLGQLQSNAFSNITGVGNVTFGNIMNAANDQMAYPLQMYGMASQLPQGANAAKEGYLSSMFDAWKTLLGDDLGKEQVKLQQYVNELNRERLEKEMDLANRRLKEEMKLALERMKHEKDLADSRFKHEKDLDSGSWWDWLF